MASSVQGKGWLMLMAADGAVTVPSKGAHDVRLIFARIVKLPQGPDDRRGTIKPAFGLRSRAVTYSKGRIQSRQLTIIRSTSPRSMFQSIRPAPAR